MAFLSSCEVYTAAVLAMLYAALRDKTVFAFFAACFLLL
jgi:hypothetical protein